MIDSQVSLYNKQMEVLPVSSHEVGMLDLVGRASNAPQAPRKEDLRCLRSGAITAFLTALAA